MLLRACHCQLLSELAQNQATQHRTHPTYLATPSLPLPVTAPPCVLNTCKLTIACKVFCGVGRPSDTHLNWSIAGAAHFGHSQTISARQKEVPPHIPPSLLLSVLMTLLAVVLLLLLLPLLQLPGLLH